MTSLLAPCLYRLLNLMNIAILNLSTPDPDFDQYGPASALIRQWITPHFSEAEFSELAISSGTPLPAPADYQGYILSGSEKGVYDDVDWMEPLKVFLIDLKAAGIPVFGICFGHQIMAATFGGSAAKADKGFVVGAKQYNSNGQLFSAHAMHRDQVIDVPPGAKVTATSSYCPVAALAYNFPAQSVQFHPEFQKTLVSYAINLFENDLIDSAEAIASRDSIDSNQVQNDLYAQECAQFFRNTL